MSQQGTFKIDYDLVADPNLYPAKNSDSEKPIFYSGLDSVTVPLSYTISDLYGQLAENLRNTHVYITIQFPCTKPPDRLLVEHPGRDMLDHSRVTEERKWIDLVGWSGYQYNTLVTMQTLSDCWPVDENGNRKSMIVTAIPKKLTENLQPFVAENREKLKKRLYLMGSMYDLFYTKENDRVIFMSTLDSKFGDRIKLFIRHCWQEFQIGVLAHFERFCSKYPLDTQGLKAHEKRYFKKKRVTLAVGEDDGLWRSVQGTPDWIARDRADVSPFPKLLDPTLMGDSFNRAIYVNGQPGTGKSQMLIYLINRLMQRYHQVAILYLLPKMPVITIIIDKSDQSNRFTVRSHPPSLREDWYTKDIPVIRIVDSVEPGEQECFTVYAASPTTYTVQIKRFKPTGTKYEGNYPFWTREEFYAMLRKLGMMGREHWIRPVSANTIINLHPLVIRLLGAHGYLVDAQSLPQLPTTASTSETNPLNTFAGRLQLDMESEITDLSEGEEENSSSLSTSEPGSLNTFADGIQPDLESEIEQGEEESKSSPSSSLLVYLNVIEVFGLSPRALSADLQPVFNRISEMFGEDGIKFDTKHSNVIMSTLAASHLENKPVSEFTARLLATMTRIKAQQFILGLDDGDILGALRGMRLEHKVNQELLRSHVRFSLLSALLDQPSYKCMFPTIDRRAYLSSQLEATETFDCNVLYYESLYDSHIKKGSSPWTGIDSFIHFINEDSIKLFAFQITVNPDHEDIKPTLIESLQSKLKKQYALTMPDMVVEVYFVWIVKPGDVAKYRDRTKVFRPSKKTQSEEYLYFRTYVVSVSDLLFNECSELDGPPDELEAIEEHWTTNNDDFKDCFVKMNNLTIYPNESAPNSVDETDFPMPPPPPAANPPRRPGIAMQLLLYSQAAQQLKRKKRADKRAAQKEKLEKD
ncbi:hypothetical protein BLNAU_6230 [Blattamonas nauphoetae]|uniref:DNA helicase n=1 Tax=Blattamonas nauphoetae TaxID=2049346 RepID=A0ABQ9Y4Q1_9EUKA|nr:hypothetical protein BLNAU_6230 [Blattamonas nauphoetae]